MKANTHTHTYIHIHTKQYTHARQHAHTIHTHALVERWLSLYCDGSFSLPYIKPPLTLSVFKSAKIHFKKNNTISSPVKRVKSYFRVINGKETRLSIVSQRSAVHCWHTRRRRAERSRWGEEFPVWCGQGLREEFPASGERRNQSSYIKWGAWLHAT